MALDLALVVDSRMGVPSAAITEFEVCKEDKIVGRELKKNYNNNKKKQKKHLRLGSALVAKGKIGVPLGAIIKFSFCEQAKY